MNARKATGIICFLSQFVAAIANGDVFSLNESGQSLTNMIQKITWAGPLPLNELGQPFANTNCQIVWAVTNTLPERLWTYHVLPTIFPPEVISNLVSLGEFKPGQKVNNLGWDHQDPRSTCYSNDKCSLGIYPRLGFIEYRYPTANDRKTGEGVPTEDQILKLGTNYLKLLGVNLSEVSKNISSVAPLSIGFGYEAPFRKTTNYYSRQVRFVRSLDGIDFYGRSHFCHIGFVHHAIPITIELSWRSLQRYQHWPVAEPEMILKWMREGKGVWQWWAPEAQGLDSSCFKRVTIKGVKLYYYGAGERESQDYVYPFAYLETEVEMEYPVGTIPQGEVNFRPSEFTNVFKVQMVSRTNSPVFMCVPIVYKPVPQ